MKKLLTMFFCILWVATVYGAESPVFTNLRVTLLNQDPDPAEPGSYLELRWKVEKYGNNKLEDIQFQLEVDHPFYFDSSDNPLRSIGSWTGYSDEDEYYILHYKVRIDATALNGSYKVRLKMKYGENSWAVEEFSIRVRRNVPVFVLGTLESSPQKLVADTDEAKITVQIANIGEGRAENVNVRLITPKGIAPSYSYSDVYAIGTIAESANEDAIFYLDIDEDIKSGYHPGSLEISYKTDNGEDYITTSLPINIPIMNRPSFEIESITTEPESIHAGDSVKLRVRVKNIGTDEAESVSLRGFKESSQPFTFDEKSDYIGKLPAGKTGEAILELKVDDDAAAKKYMIDLQVRFVYKEDVLVESEMAEITVMGARAKSNTTIWIVGLAVLIASGYGIYLWKKKMSK